MNPGFINLKLNKEFLAEYLRNMQEDENLSVEKTEHPRKIMIDYGGPNVAKPLHVGHLRSAIIGESIKRMGRLLGHEVIGDVHLGDWGLQMGLIITELKRRKPELVYFDEAFEGNTLKRLPLQSANWRRFIPQPVRAPKRMSSIKRRQCRQPLCCSMDIRDIRQS